jgi:hypothetical protein
MAFLLVLTSCCWNITVLMTRIAMDATLAGMGSQYQSQCRQYGQLHAARETASSHFLGVNRCEDRKPQDYDWTAPARNLIAAPEGVNTKIK